MSALKRIVGLVRLILAELPLTYLLISLVGFVAFTAFGYTMGTAGESDDGQLLQRINRIPEEALEVCLFLACLCGLLTISITQTSRWFKEEAQSTAFLSLPLSNWEKFAALLAFNLVIVPIIVIVPVLLATMVLYAAAPDYLILPDFGNIIVHLPEVFLIQLLSTALWLFLAIASPRRLGWVIAVGVVLFIAYIPFTRFHASNQEIELTIDDSAFRDPSVVGLYDEIDPKENVPPGVVTYDAHMEDDLPAVLRYGSMLLFFFAAYLALTRRTT